MPRIALVARRVVVVTPVFIAVVVASGCAPSFTPAIAAHSALRPVNSTAPCPPDGQGAATFSDEIDQLKLTVNAHDMQAPVKTEGNVASTLTIEQVPVGSNRLVGLFGLSGGHALWRGVAQKVNVAQGVATNIDVLMARLGDVTCGRGADDSPRAFHTATVLNDGTVLLVGGAKEGQDASGNVSCGAGCHSLSATDAASIFDPATGTYEQVGNLGSQRMFHVAVKLDDGRVVIAGGAAQALVHAAGDTSAPFPIVPSTPVATAEIYDPSSKSFSPLPIGGSDPNLGARIFAAGALTPDGSAIITGGIPNGGTTRNDLSNALDSTMLCDGNGCQAGPIMSAKRAGHFAFTVSSKNVNGVVLWGGSVNTQDADVIAGVPEYNPEVLEAAGAFRLLKTDAMRLSRNRFFAACTQYLSARAVCAGGLSRGKDGSFSTLPSDVFDPTDQLDHDEPPEAGYVFSAIDGNGTDGGIATGSSDQTMVLTTPLFFGSAAPLPGQQRAVIAGGYTDLSFKMSSLVELYDERAITKSEGAGPAPIFAPSAGGLPITLRQVRGGLVAVAPGDGTVLLTGGESGNQDPSRTPSNTVEIFADPITPPGVAE